MKKIVLLLAVCGVTIHSLKAQVNIGGMPWSINSGTALSGVDNNIYRVTPPDFEKVLKEAEAQDERGGTMYKVAEAAETDINMAAVGQYTYLPDGKVIWRARVSLSGSLGIKPLYEDFYLPQGVTFYITNGNGRQIVGGFDSRSNSSSGVMGHEMIQGDEVVFEMNIAAGVDLNDIRFRVPKLYGVFRGGVAAQLQQQYGSENPAPTLEYYSIGSSHPCHVNAVCPAAATWEPLSKTAGHIWIVIGNSGGFCSGNLINNTAKDCRPLFLTASHCDGANGMESEHFKNWEFTFGLQSPQCSGAGVIPQNKVLTGANFVARSPYPDSVTNQQSPGLIGDFLLLELKDSAQQLAAWGAYLGGWDRSGSVADTQWVSFHHPSGDIMKFTNMNSLRANGSFNTYLVGTHWSIRSVEGGSQPGSSGSAIFNAQSGRIIGDLSGGSGTAPCSADRRLLYSKLSRNWEYAEGDGTEATRLQSHLDPMETGAVTLEMAKITSGTSCADDPFQLEVTSVDHIRELEQSIHLYPNPTAGLLHVKFNTPKLTVVDIEVLNMLGNVVRTSRINNTGAAAEHTVDLNDMPSGIYMVRLRSEQASIVRKVVLSR